MLGQFNSPIVLPPSGNDIPVSGPLNNVDPSAKSATIVCVLVQGKESDPDNAVWVEGRGTWQQGDPNWVGTVSRNGTKPGGGSGSLQPGAGEVRGIATATIVRDGSVETYVDENGVTKRHLVPPSLDMITWCVGVRVTAQGAQATQTTGSATETTEIPA